MTTTTWRAIAVVWQSMQSASAHASFWFSTGPPSVTKTSERATSVSDVPSCVFTASAWLLPLSGLSAGSHGNGQLGLGGGTACGSPEAAGPWTTSGTGVPLSSDD